MEEETRTPLQKKYSIRFAPHYGSPLKVKGLGLPEATWAALEEAAKVHPFLNSTNALAAYTLIQAYTPELLSHE